MLRRTSRDENGAVARRKRSESLLVVGGLSGSLLGILEGNQLMDARAEIGVPDLDAALVMAKT
jgi:hypothetical protein